MFAGFISVKNVWLDSFLLVDQLLRVKLFQLTLAQTKFTPSLLL